MIFPPFTGVQIYILTCYRWIIQKQKDGRGILWSTKASCWQF